MHPVSKCNEPLVGNLKLGWNNRCLKPKGFPLFEWAGVKNVQGNEKRIVNQLMAVQTRRQKKGTDVVNHLEADAG